MKIRKNIINLTASERQNYVTAVKRLKAETDRKTSIAGSPINTYDYFVDMHNHAMADAHNGPAFLPWHRAYLLEFENELGRVLGDSNYALPYWDWGADAALTNPSEGLVWAFMGGNGTREKLDDNRVIRPVTTGPFRRGEWTIFSDNGADGALYRDFGSNLSTNQELIDECMDIDVFDASPWHSNSGINSSFRKKLEKPLHNALHVWVGGAMLEMTSPNDPVFFLHHCNVDRIWAEWQVKNPNQDYVPVSGAMTGHNKEDNMRWVNKTPDAMWDFAALGFTYDTVKVKITNRYVWLPQLRSLPAEISYEVTCNSMADEFLPVFSFNKVEWGRGNCDALCWYLSPHRHDFTFRTNLFGNFPRVQRPIPGFNAEVGRKYTIKCRITSTSASYDIDGRRYATASYSEGTVPAQGYFGFAVYRNENIDVDNMVVTPLGAAVPA